MFNLEKDDLITDEQQAYCIIAKVGELYQFKVVDKLRATSSARLNDTDMEKKAKEVISNMCKEYTLNVANVLWKDKFDDIPKYVKEY